MRLVISTPTRLILDRDSIEHVRAEDASGSFGIEPGHIDFLAALEVCVLEWRDPGGAGYVAVRGGVLRVRGGDVDVASREAVVGDDLETLERTAVGELRRRERDDIAARSAQRRMELELVRRLHEHLGTGG